VMSFWVLKFHLVRTILPGPWHYRALGGGRIGRTGSAGRGWGRHWRCTRWKARCCSEACCLQVSELQESLSTPVWLVRRGAPSAHRQKRKEKKKKKNAQGTSLLPGLLPFLYTPVWLVRRGDPSAHHQRGKKAQGTSLLGLMPELAHARLVGQKRGLICPPPKKEKRECARNITTGTHA